MRPKRPGRCNSPIPLHESDQYGDLVADCRPQSLILTLALHATETTSISRLVGSTSSPESRSAISTAPSEFESYLAEITRTSLLSPDAEKLELVKKDHVLPLLSVLVVEDSPDDAELIIAALLRGGLDPTWERVETAEGLRSALSAGPWDIVTSAYTMSGFGGPDALEIVRSVDPDLPFIVVSETVDEDVAVAMMRTGANDYVRKHDVARLAPAVEREVRESGNRRAKRKANQKAAHLATVVDSSNDAIMSKTLDGVIVSWNSAAERLYGWSEIEATGRNVSMLVPMDKVDELDGIMRRLRAGEKIEYFETVRLHRDGRRIDVALIISPIRDGDGQMVGISKTAHDIRERKRAEETLRLSETRYRRLFETAQDGILIVDWESGQVTDANPFLANLLGYSQENLVGKQLWEFGLFHDIEANKLAFRELQDKGYVRYRDLPLLTKDGCKIEVEFVSNEYEVGHTRVIQCNIRDITGQKRAEDDLQLRDRAIRAATQGLLITDTRKPDNPIAYVSPGFERMTGYGSEEVLGRNCRFLQGKDTDSGAVAQIHEAVATGQSCTVELLNYRKDGTKFWNELSISPVQDAAGRLSHFVGVQVDVTARRSLEDQFRQSQKMEAIGQLAGGVAHDFNNLLTVINGYGELLLERLPSGDPTRESIREMVRAGERAAGLTRQLLAFSRKAIIEPKVLNLKEVVADVERMIRRIVGEDINLAVANDPEAGAVKADPGQIEQVILNLVVNARDAMPRGGRITIKVRNAILDESYARTHPDARPGPHVLLAVTDSGCGMGAATLARIFEPFFTTKGNLGTGLGLATVHGIVRQSGGHVAVESELGHGTTFKVYLPRVEKQPSTSNSLSDSAVMPRGGETIMIVEDDDGVRALTCLIARNSGYVVLEARNGLEAVRIAGEHREQIDLLMTDVVMPKMDGREVAGRVLELHPAVKILFLSGYTDDAIVRHGILHETVNFLQKPFSPASLAVKIREILDGG